MRAVFGAGACASLGSLVALGALLLGWPIYESACAGAVAAASGGLVAVVTAREEET